MAIRKVLRDLAIAVADEAAQNPQFARRLGEILKPTSPQTPSASFVATTGASAGTRRARPCSSRYRRRGCAPLAACGIGPRTTPRHSRGARQWIKAGW